jgi:hypothetical protein
MTLHPPLPLQYSHFALELLKVRNVFSEVFLMQIRQNFGKYVPNFVFKAKKIGKRVRNFLIKGKIKILGRGGGRVIWGVGGIFPFLMV